MVAESVTWEEEDFQEKIMLMAEYRAGFGGRVLGAATCYACLAVISRAVDEKLWAELGSATRVRS